MRVSLLVLCVTVLSGTVTPGAAEPAYAESATTDDRELVVRFTRAYGMAKQALEAHAPEAPSGSERDAMLRQPNELDPPLRGEIRRILDLNGLERADWERMFARMETDEELRRRVRSLSTPFE